MFCGLLKQNSVAFCSVSEAFVLKCTGLVPLDLSLLRQFKCLNGYLHPTTEATEASVCNTLHCYHFITT